MGTFAKTIRSTSKSGTWEHRLFPYRETPFHIILSLGFELGWNSHPLVWDPARLFISFCAGIVSMFRGDASFKCLAIS